MFKPVAILGGKRTPFVKSWTHFSGVSNQEMLTFALQELADSFSLNGEKLGDVALGALLLGPRDFNLAREAVLGTKIHHDTPAYNVQRACGTGLETTWQIALKIAAGQIEVGISGGSDTNSDIPITLPKSFSHKLIRFRGAKGASQKVSEILSLRPGDLSLSLPNVNEPRTGLSMGQHCEKMVQEWKIDRRAQDELALKSHLNAAKAYDSGFYEDLVSSFRGVKRDTLVRADTTLEKLAKLKPAFEASGERTLTAGNSTPLTDGAAVALLSSEEYAKSKGLKVLAYFVDCEVAGLDFVSGEGLLMAPAQAVASLLRRNNLKLQDFDIYEIHEAFAGQVLCTLKAWESPEYCKKKLGSETPLGSIDRSKLNIRGGSLAVGHPFAATGARIVAGLAKILDERGGGRGLISVCTAGGMGVAAIVEK
jgi:acetyl-CoA C-acetyltransferase